MNRYSLAHLSDGALRNDLIAASRRESGSTAWVLAHLAEFDARRLYAEDAHPSMYSYCLSVLHLSEDAAYKRIQAARAARRFPAIFAAVAAGRLHLSAVCLLAPHLTAANATELLEAAAWKRKAEVELLLAARFPRPDFAAGIEALRAPASTGPVAAAPAAVSSPADLTQLAPGQVMSSPGAEPERAARPVAPPCLAAAPILPAPAPLPRLMPLAPQRYGLQFTIAQGTYERLCRVQELMGRSTPQSELAEVFDQALELLERQLQRRKFAAADRPRTSQRGPSRNSRHIPARVKRAVWRRDGGQCSFVSDSGQRCPARDALEYDHVQPVARGGEATVANLRLRCRAHNQLEAERAFGAGFMHRKRQECRSTTERDGRAAESPT